MDITQQHIDDMIVEEITIDLTSGVFYQEADDETLELALISMWEDIEYDDECWERRGIILGIS